MERSSPAPMPIALQAAIAAYITLLHVALLAALLLLWPSQPAPRFAMPLELRYLLLVCSSGALGSTLHLASSFVEHAARGQLHTRWGLWYFLRPLIGVSLALMAYLLLRGGLLAGPGTAATESLNPYGMTALAALAGLFSRQAMRKLKETFEHLCMTREEEPAPPAE